MEPFLYYNLFELFFGESNHTGNVTSETLLEISQPLLIQVNYLDDVYLAYCLQDRTAITDEKKAVIQELLLVKTDHVTVNKLKNNQLTIYEALSNSVEKWRMGRINNRHYPAEKITTLDSVKDRIPKEEVKLKDVPNKITKNG